MKKYRFVQSARSPYTLREGDNFADVISGDSAFKCRSLWHWPLTTEVHAYTNKTKGSAESNCVIRGSERRYLNLDTYLYG